MFARLATSQTLLELLGIVVEAELMAEVFAACVGHVTSFIVGQVVHVNLLPIPRRRYQADPWL